jgi:hypothetical protein
MTPDLTAGLILVAIVLVGNFIPSMIGFSRGVAHPWLLLFGNIIFGWTVLGWFIALVYAVAGEAPKRTPRPMRTAAYYDTHDIFPRRREPRL